MHFNVLVAVWIGDLDQRSCATSGPVSTAMGDPLLADKPSRKRNQQPRSTQPGHPSVGRRSE